MLTALLFLAFAFVDKKACLPSFPRIRETVFVQKKKKKRNKRRWGDHYDIRSFWRSWEFHNSKKII